MPETSDIITLCCIEFLNGCTDVINSHYFAARLGNTLCCYNCGAFGGLCTITAEMKQNYQTVHPVCNECYATGAKERTRRPRFSGRKRTATEASL